MCFLAHLKFNYFINMKQDHEEFNIKNYLIYVYDHMEKESTEVQVPWK